MKHTTALATALATGLATVAGLAAATLVVAPTAQASGGDDVRTSGTCSAGATWKLKVKSDDGLIEAEAEVDSNVTGQAWAWTMRDNGALVARGTSTTVAPSGSFGVEKRIADRAGTDTVTFRATYAGQVCSGRVTL